MLYQMIAPIDMRSSMEIFNRHMKYKFFICPKNDLVETVAGNFPIIYVKEIESRYYSQANEILEEGNL